LLPDEARRAHEHVARRDAERLPHRLRGRMRGLEALGAREAVGAARVEHDRAHGAVGDHLLGPQDRVGLRPVAREDGGGAAQRALVDHEREVALAEALESRGDPRRGEAGGGGDAHGATPFTVRPRCSGRPSAMLADWIAAPAVPLTRLSIAETTTTRPAFSSTATPMRAVLAPVVSFERGKEPSGNTRTKRSPA